MNMGYLSIYLGLLPFLSVRFCVFLNLLKLFCGLTYGLWWNVPYAFEKYVLLLFNGIFCICLLGPFLPIMLPKLTDFLLIYYLYIYALLKIEDWGSYYYYSISYPQICICFIYLSALMLGAYMLYPLNELNILLMNWSFLSLVIDLVSCYCFWLTVYFVWCKYS